MKRTPHNAKSPSTPKTGLFATRGGSLPANGSGGLSSPRARVALASLTAVAVLLALGASSALAGTAHVFHGAFGPDCTETTGFKSPGAVAVDQATHDIYVADLGTGTVVRCSANGTPVEFTAGTGAGTNKLGGFGFVPEFGTGEIAVNSETHDFYVADIVSGAIKAFHQNGEAANFSALPSNEIHGAFVCGVAVDANGDIYMGEAESGVHVFAPSGEEITSFPSTQPCNVGVDSHGDVYANGLFETHPGVEKFIPSEVPVTKTTTYSDAGVIDPSPIFAIAVDRSSDELYVDKRLAFEQSQIAQYDEHGASAGAFAGPGEPGALNASEGVGVDEITGSVYVSNAGFENHGKHQVEIFLAPLPVPPVIESTSAVDVTSTSTNLQAQIDPRQFDTHFHFEYLTEAEYQANKETFAGAHSTPEIDLGSSAQTQAAHGHAGGLTPDTTYRFRVIAESEGGTVASPEPAPHFNTPPLLAPGLPDGRVYEMVSPPQKSGEVFPPNGLSGGSCGDCLPGEVTVFMPMQSAPDGEAVVYMGDPFFSGLSSAPNEYLSRRGPGGWETHSLSSSAMEGANYRAVSPDLSRSVLFQQKPALSAETPTQGGESFADLYLRSEGGLLQPLVTVEPPNRNTEPPGQVREGFGIDYSGANSGTSMQPAFGHVVFEANDALTEEVKGVAPKAPEIAAGEVCGGRLPGAHCDLYEWAGGGVRLVNVLPGNAVAATTAVIGSGDLVESEPKNEGVDVDHAISADGRRIFWSDEGTGQVYVRIDGRETLEVPSPGLCKRSLPLAQRVCFLTASTDGSQVLLSDGEIYELNEGAKAYEQRTDLAQGHGGFQGILGAAEDLSSVYFVDTAVLSGENTEQHLPLAGEYNLYVYEPDPAKPGQFKTVFIGTIGGDNDLFQDSYGDWSPFSKARSAQVSFDGRYLAFMSRAPLTGYDNERAGGGSCDLSPNDTRACPEVFEYGASSGKLACASCNPTGQQPLGPSKLSLARPDTNFFPSPQLDNLSRDGAGRLFFDSQDVLSPRDTNAAIQDVYEWEPNGLGSCKRSGGCVFLISSGNSPNDSLFLGSSSSGDDVFFVTREQLLPQDKNEQLDLYDARVGGGIAASQTPPCGGEACRGPLTGAPPSPAPASSLFSGPGNLTSPLTAPVVLTPRATRAQKLAKALKLCAKKPNRKRRRACRTQARGRYGPTTMAKAGHKAESHTGRR